MTTVNLAKYKSIDQRTKDLISGFIRNVAAQLQLKSATFNIPELIYYICALFYYLTDKWNRDRTSSKYIISEDNVTIESIEVYDVHYMAFLTTVAMQGQHRWRLKINEWGTGYDRYIIIGIVKNEIIDKLIEESEYGFYLGRIENTAYCFDVDAADLNIHNSRDDWTEYKYGIEAKEGDIIDMYLDLDTLQLGYAINDTYYGKAFDVEAGYGYIGAVSTELENVRLTLLTYDNDTCDVL